MRTLHRVTWSRLLPLVVAACSSTDPGDSGDGGGGCSGDVRGTLDRGSFTTSDCPGGATLPGESSCLEAQAFAAGARARLRFVADDGRAVITGASSTAPGVVRIDAVVAEPEGGAAEIDLTTLAGGDAVVQVDQATGTIDQLPIRVVPVGAVAVTVPRKIVVGGAVAIGGTVTSAGGEPLIGRGAYALTAGAGLAITPVPLGTAGLLLARGPDYVIRATAPGDHVLTTTPATAGELRMTAIPPAALREIRLTASEIVLDAARGDAWAAVWVGATDAVGDAVVGTPCEWRASRPVWFESLAPYADAVIVRSPVAAPVDVTCLVEGLPRATATIR